MLYITACVVLPLAWGLIVVFVSTRIDHWAKSRKVQSEQGNSINEDATRVEYHI